VKSVADRHGAEVTLGEGIDGAGLGVSVRFRNQPPGERS
jgi:hypothetical protein